LRVVKVDKPAIITKEILKEKISCLIIIINGMVSPGFCANHIHIHTIYNGYKLAFASLILEGLPIRVCII
jgi:adenine deaminase